MDVGVARVEVGRAVLADDQTITFSYTMFVPPLLDQEVVRAAAQIADVKGYVKVRDPYQAEVYDDVYAVGDVAAVPAPWQTSTPLGIPKAGSPTGRMAHVDAGKNGVIVLGDKMLSPRKRRVLIPGPQAHATKLPSRTTSCGKARHGYVDLP